MFKLKDSAVQMILESSDMQGVLAKNLLCDVATIRRYVKENAWDGEMTKLALAWTFQYYRGELPQNMYIVYAE
jgi:hypothetical protein